jgi:hypothetical protein
MPSDTVFSIGGHTIQFSSVYLLVGGMVLLTIAGFLLGFSRGKRMVLQRSVRTEELVAQLGRIAETLERIGNQPAYRLIAEASSRDLESVSAPEAETTLQPAAEPPSRERAAHSIPYSMFGREIFDR